MRTLILASSFALMTVASNLHGAAATSETVAAIESFSTKVLNTVISANVTIHTTYHNRQAIEEFAEKPGIRVADTPGNTSQTLESDHTLSYTIGHDSFFAQYELRPGTKHHTKLVQQYRDSRPLTIETSNGRSVYSNDVDSFEPICNFVLLLPDRNPKNGILKASKVEVDQEQITIQNPNLEIVLRNGAAPYMLSKTLRQNDKLFRVQEFSDHVEYKSLWLPRKIVDKMYAKNGDIFRTITYDVSYTDSSEADQRLVRKLEIPAGATKGKTALIN